MAQVHTQMAKEMENKEEEELEYVNHQKLMGLIWNTCLLMDSKSSVIF